MAGQGRDRNGPGERVKGHVCLGRFRGESLEGRLGVDVDGRAALPPGSHLALKDFCLLPIKQRFCRRMLSEPCQLHNLE